MASQSDTESLFATQTKNIFIVQLYWNYEETNMLVTLLKFLAWVDIIFLLCIISLMIYVNMFHVNYETVIYLPYILIVGVIILTGILITYFMWVEQNNKR